MSRRYIVGTGWWCDGSGGHDGFAEKNDDVTRLQAKRDFFRLWHAFVDHYTRPDRIVVVDSASPVQPPLPDDDRIELLHLNANYGHPVTSEPAGIMSGVERCHMALAAWAYVNDYDLVYVEQDCLVRGDGWVDHAFEHMRGGRMMYGPGRGTPQPIQESVLLVRHAFLPTFFGRLGEAWRRNQHGPWWDLLRWPRFGNGPEKRKYRMFRRDADWLPFDGGRPRPLDFTQKYLYAQHWTEDELERFVAGEAWMPSELIDLVRKRA